MSWLAVLLSALFFSGTLGFTCCEFKNFYEPSLLGMACAGDGYQCPSDIPGWGNPFRSKFAVNCEQCGYDWGEGDFTLVETKPTLVPSPPSPKEFEEEVSDPVHCCLYSKKEYYYTQPIYTVAPNPHGTNPFCPSTQYGVPMIAEWWVDSMYNQCFFLQARNNSAVGAEK